MPIRFLFLAYLMQVQRAACVTHLSQNTGQKRNKAA